METKNFGLEVKQLNEDGTFEGSLAVYGNRDECGDVIANSAFRKTLLDNGPTVPLLWCHDASQILGSLTLEDTPRALKATGKLVLSVTRAREAYDLLKAGAIRGLSIGYKTIKSDMKDGVRFLREVRLFEGSLTALPANSLAVVTSVKTAAEDPETSEDLAALRHAARDLKAFYEKVLD